MIDLALGGGPTAAAPSAAGAPVIARDRLEEARALMREANHDGAAFVALDVLKSTPGKGAAYMVLGLARFHGQRYEEALQAFAAARRSADAPPAGLLAFNEASTLYALGRYAAAEGAFTTAARADASLAALATLNAGHAALGAGALDRASGYVAAAALLPGGTDLSADAAELRQRIRQAGAARVAASIDELRVAAKQALGRGDSAGAIALYRRAAVEADGAETDADTRAELHFALGNALYEAQVYHEAGLQFAQAATMAPREAEFRYMQGMASYRLDRPTEARTALEAALDLGLETDLAGSVRATLAGLESGLAAQGEGMYLHAAAGSGYDSNVGQLGAVNTEVVGAELAGNQGSFLVTATADATWGMRAGRSEFFQISYLFDQIAYTQVESDFFSLQVHALDAGAETRQGPVHLGLLAGAGLHFSGLRSFSPLQRVLWVKPRFGLDEGDHTSTWLSLQFQHKQAADPSEEYLTGTRVDLRVSQKLRWRSLRAEMAYRHSRETIGVRQVDLGELRSNLYGQYRIPYSYRLHGALLSTAMTVTGGLRVTFDGSFEHVRYVEPNVLTVAGTGGETRNSLRRVDDRVGVGCGVAYAIYSSLELALQYDVVVNNSTLRFAFDDKNFIKHMVGIELNLDY